MPEAAGNAQEPQPAPGHDERSVEWAEDAFSRIAHLARDPFALSRSFNAIEQEFVKAERLDLLLDWLSSADPDQTHCLQLITKGVELALNAGRPDLADEILARHAALLTPVRFTNNDRLKRFVRLGVGIVRKLDAMKYAADRGRPRRGENLFDCARRVADRIHLDPILLDCLYDARMKRDYPRDAWEREVRISHCVDHLIVDRYPYSFAGLIGAEEIDRLAELLRSLRGGVVVGFHGGYVAVGVHLFYQIIPDGWALGSRLEAKRNFIQAKGDPGAGLFAALRTVEDGNLILMYPDALIGNRSSTIEVAGLSVPIASGTMFTAFETGCATLWLGTRRRGDTLVPDPHLGPVREPGERFKAFSARWLAFYSERLNATLTGDPENICFQLGGLAWPLTREAMRVRQQLDRPTPPNQSSHAIEPGADASRLEKQGR